MLYLKGFSYLPLFYKTLLLLINLYCEVIYSYILLLLCCIGKTYLNALTYRRPCCLYIYIKCFFHYHSSSTKFRPLYRRSHSALLPYGRRAPCLPSNYLPSYRLTHCLSYNWWRPLHIFYKKR